MLYFLRSLRRKRYLIASNLALAVVLFQFNNCSEGKSGMKESSTSSATLPSTDAGSSAPPAQTPGNTAGAPIDPLNPYILQCIVSSDAQIVSAKLKASAAPAKNGLSTNKISSIDWAQDEDLIVTLDNHCVRNSHYADPVLKYVDASQLREDLPLSVYVIRKESVTNLKLFLENALSSECLMAADKNTKLKVSADAADPYFGLQAHLTSIGATDSYLANVMAYNQGNLYKSKVAVIDTGVDITHPDLVDNLARDTSGRIVGLNATGASTDLSDSGFHGTHVTGLIGAGFRNGVGGSGVYGRNIEIYPARASNDGATLSIADVSNAIIWAADKNVDLINMSLGSPTDSTVMKNAISYAISKNVTIVVAAGNDGKLLEAAAPVYPAMYSAQFQGLITVGSYDAGTGDRSSFSNYSPSYVDILSPGSNGASGIVSTVPVALTANGSGMGSKTPSPIQGTSMAAPVVTGALAAAISLAKAKGVTLTNADLETYLKGDASPKNSKYTGFSYNGSYLNLPVLLNFIKSKVEVAPPPTPVPDTLSIITQPASKQVVSGENIDIGVEIVSNLTPSYQWYQNNTKIPGATSKKLNFNKITTASAGSYYVEVSAGAKKIVSQKAEVKVAAKYCK